MNFLENGLILKLVPENIKDIKVGKIIDIKDNSFSAKFNVDVSKIFELNEVEVLVNINSGVLKFFSNILSVNNDTIELNIPEKYTTVQRREYPRININIPVKLFGLNEIEEIDSITEDISGGGMRLSSEKDVETGKEVTAKLKITDNKSINAKFKVLRVTKEFKVEKNIVLSGKFSDIAHSDRTAIIQLCFRKQLEQKFRKMRND